MLIGILTGSPTLHLDGEESPTEANNLTKTKSESEIVQTNEFKNEDTVPLTTSTDPSNSSTINESSFKDNNSSKDFTSLFNNEASSSDKGSATINQSSRKDMSISDMFSEMYLKLHEHEEKLLDNEKKNYIETGVMPDVEDSYFDKMGDFRQNDQVNLANHIKSSTVAEEFSGDPENKRHIGDIEDENIKNKAPKKIK